MTDCVPVQVLLSVRTSMFTYVNTHVLQRAAEGSRGQQSFCNSKLCMTDNLGRILRVAEIILLLLLKETINGSNTKRERSLKVHVGV